MRSLIGWVGGKSRLASTILSLLPEHDCYVEVFAGAASVLFHKEPGGNEVYNDLNGDLVNLFLCAREHPDELARQVDWFVHSRQMFDAFRRQPGLTDIQRAARFLYLVRCSVNSLGKAFAFARGPKFARFMAERVQLAIAEVHDRFRRVTVEHADFGAVIARYDSPRTAFYADPPYVGKEHLYAVSFSRQDHERLRACFDGIKGRWLLSYNDHPWVRQAYAPFHLHAVDVPYTADLRSGRRDVGELLIANYRPTRAQLRAAPRTVTRIRKPRKRRT